MTDTPKVAMITGGASGLGFATARKLLSEDWHVALADRDEAALDRALAELGDAVSAHPLDVTDAEAVTRAVDGIHGLHGRIDALMQSAGIARDIPFLETTPEQYREVIEINLTGSFLVGQAVARKMAAGQGGAIVNLASTSGLVGNLGRAAYGSSKGGIVILTKVMAIELAPLGIRVNAIAPGPIETPLLKELHGPEVRRRVVSEIPLRRYGMPEEVAQMASFLMDDERSGFITGQTYALDGGFSAGGTIRTNFDDLDDIIPIPPGT